MKYYFTIILLFLVSAIYGQQLDTGISKQQKDSGRLTLVQKIQAVGANEAKRSIEKYKEGRIAIHQHALLDEILKINQKVKIHLKKTVDTAAIIRELEKTRAAIDIVNDGVFVNKGTSQTQRNLSVSSAVINELLIKLTVTKNTLDNYTKALVLYKDRIDSLYSDSTLYFFSSDSVETIKYYRKLVVVSKDLGPVDTLMDKYLAAMPKVQERVDLMVNELHASYDDIERYRDEISLSAFDREFPNIWEPAKNMRPFNEIVKFSFEKEKLALGFYINDNEFLLALLVLLVLAATYFIRSLKEKLKNDQLQVGDARGKLLVRYPFNSALLIVISLFQFAFTDPPFIFSFILWLISAVCLCRIFKNFITPFWFRFWIIMVVLFVLAGLDNMILQASRTERWWMLALAGFGVVYGFYLLLSDRKRDLKEKKILVFIALVVFFESASIVLNIFGRYNISKTFLATGYLGLVIAILFLWTVRLINEGLGHANAVYKHPDKKLFFINFDRVGDRVPGLFYVLLIFGWFILIGRNFYAFKQITEPFLEFLKEERIVGNYAFTVNGILVFILILFCSLFLSRVISFFTSETDISHTTASHSNKPGIGSWILLVRIVVISFGLFLALAASGFPLDKITIVLGALGVGIGLGLQGLVNNLVSGLIIAFEKPVNVGDIIDIDGRTGFMKSIGFRSSVVVTGDGSSIIIPNGDLLSQHLVNWSMGKNKKRINIIVGVEYNTNISNAIKLLEGVLTNNDRILKTPPPNVFAKDFNQYSIDFEIQFWVAHLKDGAMVKSEVITEIDKVFRENGIVIPLPQQDLHVKTIEGPSVENKTMVPGQKSDQ